MNYPFLCENIIPLLPPVEIAARLAREKALREHPELKSEEIGVIFISPCPAKVSYVKNGFAGESNNIDEIISVRDVYFVLIDKMKQFKEEPADFTEAGMIGIGWASTGGEASAVFNDRYLAADGIEDCIRVLEQIDNEDITNLDYVELNACSGGCVGGAMTVANPYIAQTRLQNLKRYLPVSPNRPDGDEIPDNAYVTAAIEYNPYNMLSENRTVARQMLAEMQSICTGLPGLDCGSCGAPTCMAFAEDIVKGETNVDECTVIMRMLFHEYLEQHKDKALLDKLKPLKQAPSHDQKSAD